MQILHQAFKPKIGTNQTCHLSTGTCVANSCNLPTSPPAHADLGGRAAGALCSFKWIKPESRADYQRTTRHLSHICPLVMSVRHHLFSASSTQSAPAPFPRRPKLARMRSREQTARQLQAPIKCSLSLHLQMTCTHSLTKLQPTCHVRSQALHTTAVDLPQTLQIMWVQRLAAETWR